MAATYISAREYAELRPGGLPAWVIQDATFTTLLSGDLGGFNVAHPAPVVISCADNAFTLLLIANAVDFHTIGCCVAVLGCVSSNPGVRISLEAVVGYGTAAQRLGMLAEGRVNLPPESPAYFGAPLINLIAGGSREIDPDNLADYNGFLNNICEVELTFRAVDFLGADANIGTLSIGKIWVGEAVEMVKNHTQNANAVDIVEGIVAQPLPQITQGGQDWNPRGQVIRHFISCRLLNVGTDFWLKALLPRFESRMNRPLIFAVPYATGGLRNERLAYHGVRVGELAAVHHSKTKSGEFLRSVQLRIENSYP